MRLPIFALLTLLFATAPAPAGGLRFTGNKSVAVEISLKDSLLAPGATGEIAITFRPVEGIHINLQPPIDFKLDTASRASLTGSLALPKGSPYLATSAPVVQRFQIPANAASGRFTLKGTLTYFYCSDKDGWCSKYKQPVEIPLTVRR